MRPVRLLVAAIVVAALIWAIAEWAVPSAVSSAISKASRESAGVPASVERVDVGWTSGSMLLDNLVIDTPVGFDADHTLRIDRVEMRVDLASLAQKVMVIDRVDVVGAELILEQRAARFSTREIAGHVRQYLSAVDTTGAKRFRITELHVVGGRARLTTDGGDAGSFDVPDLVLRNLGGDSGAPLAAILAHTLEPLLERTSANIDSLPDALGRLRDRFGI